MKYINKYTTTIAAFTTFTILTSIFILPASSDNHSIPAKEKYSEYEDRWGGRHHMRRKRKKLNFLRRADANQDGIVTIEEVEQLRAKRFNRFDTDKNGIISKEEIEQRIRARIEKRVKRLTRKFDRNSDGKITKDEFNWLAKERFKWHDLNDDGKLSDDELPRRFFRHNRRHR